jgi:hypothetical protein
LAEPAGAGRRVLMIPFGLVQVELVDDPLQVRAGQYLLLQ